MDSEQGATSLLESVKTHVNERLKSPFGGAFVISWVVINWENLFVLILSEKDAETRAKVFAGQMDNWSGLWAPILYAAIGLVSYYALSGAAVALFEAYGVFRRYVEQKFDNYRWVPPGQYIDWKKESNRTIKEFQDIAADKFDKILSLENQIGSMEIEKIRLEGKITELVSLEGEAKSEVRRLKEENAAMHRTILEVRESSKIEANERIEKHCNELVRLSDDLDMDIRRLMQVVGVESIPEEYLQIIRSVVNSGSRLVDVIDKNISHKPF